MSLILLYHSHICSVLDPPAVLSCPTMHYLRSNPFHTIPIRFKQLSFLPSCSTELPLPPCSELSNHVSTSTQPRPASLTPLSSLLLGILPHHPSIEWDTIQALSLSQTSTTPLYCLFPFHFCKKINFRFRSTFWHLPSQWELQSSSKMSLPRSFQFHYHCFIHYLASCSVYFLAVPSTPFPQFCPFSHRQAELGKTLSSVTQSRLSTSHISHLDIQTLNYQSSKHSDPFASNQPQSHYIHFPHTLLCFALPIHFVLLTKGAVNQETIFFVQPRSPPFQYQHTAALIYVPSPL